MRETISALPHTFSWLGLIFNYDCYNAAGRIEEETSNKMYK
jgi:hypothetical protein